jgi:hypothetical protein
VARVCVHSKVSTQQRRELPTFLRPALAASSSITVLGSGVPLFIFYNLTVCVLESLNGILLSSSWFSPL